MQPIQISEPLEFLFRPARYKVAYGGRDSTKSWGFARALITLAHAQPMRILCARELQNSIKDSVHRLLSDQIVAMGLEDQFDVRNNEVRGKRCGSLFLFEGLRFNVNKIKSLEGIDICWVEEAVNVSKNSWQVLVPTIRKPGSEIWVSFNPELETDETYQRFVRNPPPGAVVRKLTYRDNPWLSQVSKDEIVHLQSTNPDEYAHVYGGVCQPTAKGAIYAAELRAADLDGRITRVPYDASLPVQAFWDLGWSDHTSIWFVQRVGFEYRVVDCYQNRLQKTPFYIGILQERGYQFSHLWLPHDADHEHMNSESIAKTVKKAFPNARVDVVPRVPRKELDFEAVREIFPLCWIDADHCQDGVQALRHYKYEIDERGQWSKQPLHDENSHFADAFATFARSVSRKHEVKKAQEIRVINYTKDEASAAWMG